MFNLAKKRKVLVGLAGLLALLTVSLAPVPASTVEVEIFTGVLTRISGNKITLEHTKVFEPANEHAKVPKWAETGTRVKVAYYTQNYVKYYYEIGEPGKKLEKEKELEGGPDREF